MDLEWTAATADAFIDIWRDGAMLVDDYDGSLYGEGMYTDYIGKSGGTYEYYVCEDDNMTNCSNVVTVTF